MDSTQLSSDRVRVRKVAMDNFHCVIMVCANSRREKLRVLGVLHNFVIKRSDGRTAANRYFGQEHREIFPWLVEHMPLPPRPRRKVKS